MSDDNVPITLEYGESYKDIVGKLQWMPDNIKLSMLKDHLHQYIIAPYYIAHGDGTKEVLGWSLINRDRYKPSNE